jgi:hypothetical protein
MNKKINDIYTLNKYLQKQVVTTLTLCCRINENEIILVVPGLSDKSYQIFEKAVEHLKSIGFELTHISNTLAIFSTKGLEEFFNVLKLRNEVFYLPNNF